MSQADVYEPRLMHILGVLQMVDCVGCVRCGRDVGYYVFCHVYILPFLLTKTMWLSWHQNHCPFIQHSHHWCILGICLHSYIQAVPVLVGQVSHTLLVCVCLSTQPQHTVHHCISQCLPPLFVIMNVSACQSQHQSVTPHLFVQFLTKFKLVSYHQIVIPQMSVQSVTLVSHTTVAIC